MDFALIMLLILVATGTIWALDRLLLAEGRERRAKALSQAGKAEEATQARREPAYVEYARAFFPVILIVFLIRSFMVEPFRIPSGSMLPSLHIGDFILVNKYTYGVRLPVINAKIADSGQPKRGEVMVFRFPGNPSINYIKRVVGIPGDHILYKDKKLYINGAPMDQSDGRPYFFDSGSDARGEALRLIENLDGVKHDILTTNRQDMPLPEIVVPPGQYFVMGDNRDHSNDSRYWGFVPDQNLVGKAFLIWFSWDMADDGKAFWQRIVWNRIGHSIH
ncbi:MAG: signal peptidase I [Gammaproteobacteria bacterium]|nr:signal peptidase I [Gammaproteobacteria bacterium]